jgi:UDP-GlcNAc:undecaprenyl-phosphate GlcNAc-1-phosphate transferase
MIYIFYLILLFIAELAYFKIADRYNIIDKPNHRSSHTEITIRGGGIIFPIAILVWFTTSGFHYPLFVLGLVLISTVSFIDDIKECPKRWRLSAHLVAMLLVLMQFNLLSMHWLLIGVLFFFFIGVINAYNFMDGINGITGIYSLVALLTLLWINLYQINFVDSSLLGAVSIAVLIFNFFNSRGKAKCFAGDVGSISIAFVICFLLIKLILQTSDIRYILLLSIYGVDAVFTIALRLYKHENIFLPHRSHLYQLLANELKFQHLTIAISYGGTQLIVNILLIYFINLNAYKVVTIFIVLLLAFYIITRFAVHKKQLSKTVNL